MASKKKGLEEDQMDDVSVVIDDDEVKDSKTDESETTGQIKSADEYGKAAPAPEDTVNIIQGIRVAALSEAAATMSATEIATQFSDLLKDTAQTATQQLKVNSENKKGDSISELSKAIALANKGVNLKASPDSEVTKSNPAKDTKINFESEVKEGEACMENKMPDYEEMQKISDEIDSKKAKELDKG